MIYSVPVLASVLGALGLVHGKIYFKEDFNSKDWEKRYVEMLTVLHGFNIWKLDG